MANGGYLTLNRAACGYLYLAGLMDISGFNSANAFFQQETGPGAGPAGFATAIFESVNTSIRYAGINPGYNAPPATTSSPSSTQTSGSSTSATSGATTASSTSAGTTNSAPVAGSSTSGSTASTAIAGPVFATPSAPGVWQYDFGATGSPVAAGYVPVATAAYSAAAGYGWTSGQVDTRDRGALPGTSALTEDFVTTAAATFAVAVPNGTYTVTVTLGDASYAHGPMGVSLQGQQVDSLATAAGQFAARTYTAVVSGGQLVLGLKNLSANPSDQVTIDALSIAAVATPIMSNSSTDDDNATDAAIESLVTESSGSVPQA